MFYSPLRYPGGKNKLAKFISQICVDNKINGHYVEPYAGGASVALFMLFENKVKEITINDFDRSIFAFWHSVLHETEDLCKLIQDTEINMLNWEKARRVQKAKDTTDLLTLGFSTLFLNRTNRSGIMDGGVIGGKNQEGRYKIDCRFNKELTIQKIKRIGAEKNRIHVKNMDAARLIKKIGESAGEANTIFYFDPPYYLKGSSLYVNHYKHADHEEIGELIKSLERVHWIVTYDNTPEIESIYEWVTEKRTKKYTLQHSANLHKEGKEIIFFSKDLVVPEEVIIGNK